MSKLTALGHIGLAFETTYGTAVVPTVFIPYETIKVEDDIKKVADEGRRAVLSKLFQEYASTKQSKVEVDFFAYPDVLGYFLKAMLGQYAVTGTGAPYSHKFTETITAILSTTLGDFNTVNERKYAGSVLDEFSLKFDTSGAVKASAKFQGKASVIGTTSTPTFTTLNSIMGFQLTAKIGGTTNLNLVGGEVSFKRDNKLLFTAQNTQDVTKFATGRIECSGKLTFDVEDETELLLYLNGTQPTLDLLFTYDANTSLDLSFGKVDITKATADRSQEFLRVDAEFKALWNTTDSGVATVTLKNAVATY